MAQLGSLYPDFVRLEFARLKKGAGTTASADVIHRFGARMLVRDVETEQEMAAAVRAGADLLQGGFLGEATPEVGSISRNARDQCSHPGSAW